MIRPILLLDKIIYFTIIKLYFSLLNPRTLFRVRELRRFFVVFMPMGKQAILWYDKARL